MIFERYEKLPDGVIVRHREVQEELVEWVEISPRCHEQRMCEA